MDQSSDPGLPKQYDLSQDEASSDILGKGNDMQQLILNSKEGNQMMYGGQLLAGPSGNEQIQGAVGHSKTVKTFPRDAEAQGAPDLCMPKTSPTRTEEATKGETPKSYLPSDDLAIELT